MTPESTISSSATILSNGVSHTPSDSSRTPSGIPLANKNGYGPPSLPYRKLRTRLSEPSQNILPSEKRSDSVSTLRKPSEQELNYIQRRLGAEGVYVRRQELLKEKEAGFKQVVDGHDDAVREKFHLEKFISLLEGWDPVVSLPR